ncbi:beta-glucosidase [Dyella thiooxydans]|uniref:Beta-glucosidase n=1 Tax=Dyella thiooxydans TaxID=445710 RepID=A0A161JJF6_9GAMM|nr:glycoside hydrolase family 3 C-terminal domain-containing protein [Dyella thiooxydans]AND70269.1 beta-glucosidase [Dyella thiooxydans]
MAFRPRLLRTLLTAGIAASLAGLAGTVAAADAPVARPWMNASLSPDQRADLLVKAMTQDEKFRLLRSEYGADFEGQHNKPAGSLGTAGFIPAMPRLGLPAIHETDAGQGVARPLLFGDGDTALPAGLAVAASFDPKVAYAGGAMIGREAHRMGFGVLLAGGVNLARDPRNGRNFEYAGEDPLLAGTIVGAAIRGIQAEHEVSTVKHYAMNDLETDRTTLSANIDETAARESDLLAFEIAIADGHPGSVMCSYNRINSVYACENDWLLNQVLKRDWKYPGFVMSDWGAVHSAAKSALAGLDQESAGERFDKQVYFDQPLRQAVARGEVPQSRIDDMVHRILRSFFAVGAFEHPAKVAPIDYAADATVSQRAAEEGIVLLRNQDHALPLAGAVGQVAVIGSHADVGVTTGGGSSGVKPRGGSPVTGVAPTAWPGPKVYQRSSPMQAIAKRNGGKVAYASGEDIAAAAKLAAQSKVAIVFAEQWTAESFDVPTMDLPGNQDALIAAVAKANPHTLVVLQTNGAVKMPWLDQVQGVLEAWYPGANGGEAIARVLFGEVDASGRLPVTWPKDESQLPRPSIPGAGLASIGIPPQGQPQQDIDYDIEGADVGYRWFEKKGLQPLFPFGYGLAYTSFAYGTPKLENHDGAISVSVRVTNTGKRAGVAVPQLYVAPPQGDTTRRLAGWQRVSLKPGESREVRVAASPVRLAHYDAAKRGWARDAGRYRFALGTDAATMLKADLSVGLPAATCTLEACTPAAH